MPVRSFDEWEQAVVNRKLKEAETRAEETAAPKTAPKAPSSVLRLRLKGLAKLVAGLCLAGCLFLLVIQQFPEKLEPVFAFVEYVLSKI
jgi:hypothetical protein